MAGEAGCERIHKEKKVQRAKGVVYFPWGGRGLGAGMAPALRGPACAFLSGNGLVVEQGVSGGLVLAAACFNVIRGCRVQSLGSGLSCPISPGASAPSGHFQ